MWREINIIWFYPQLTVACGKNPEALPFGEAHSAAEFEAINMNLDKCQKSLTEYLDSKRLKFPRFYFISKEDLLCILGNSDPKSIQEHLIKVKNDLKNKSNLISNTLISFQMFDNIKSLKLSRDQFDVPCAIAMISSEGEQMIFRKPGKKIYEWELITYNYSILNAQQSHSSAVSKIGWRMWCTKCIVPIVSSPNRQHTSTAKSVQYCDLNGYERTWGWSPWPLVRSGGRPR